MDIQTVTGLIGTLGFPVVLSGFLVWFVTTKFIAALDKTTGALEKSNILMGIVAEKLGVRIDG